MSVSVGVGAREQTKLDKAEAKGRREGGKERDRGRVRERREEEGMR